MQADSTNPVLNSPTVEKVIKPMGHYPLRIVRGEGVRFWDEEGTEYLDAVSGEWVVNLGYRHPKVVAAIKEQLDSIEYVTPVFENEQRTKLAEKVLSKAPKNMRSVLFALSGADAVEGAMHLAMRATGGSEFVSLFSAFHGTTFSTLALSYSYPKMLEGSKEGLDRYLTRQIRVPNYNCYRCPFGLKPGSCDMLCARYIDTAIKHQPDAKVAGVIIELFQSNGGMIPMPEGYIEMVREICTKNGVALIADEVQTAFSRCGDIFASNVVGVEPDLIVMGKAFGAGLPLSGVVAGEGFTSLRGWEAGFTLMATPAVCAGSLAMLEVMEEEDLGKNSTEIGAHMVARLNDMKERYSIIGDVRGLGLMIGVELVKDRESKEPADELTGFVWKDALEKQRLLLGKSGPVFGDFGNVIKLKPAVNTTRDQADEMLDRLERSLAAAQARLDRMH
ncbi:aspartate aminotransferase family protein [Aestuariivirga sp. YIM B02566]|uniref:Aspartate aminotransferase family protein n=1 Tax=Taklimakanibacter albus TaxID=2800327 RepID=A0ACC5R2G1_9HYPH|nr:aspartate aminotransferase family protein [Aestuariivirga sp. YIM B02566]MBK1866830.1 aspartate aminotransferase family protein [Aestuariivirga sp. YIM B02566]